jgi:hypothetical protein
MKKIKFAKKLHGNIKIVRIARHENMENFKNYCLRYGTIINDFHTLDKNTIYTLSICAIQDIYRSQQSLKHKISSLYNNLELSIISTTNLNDIQNISSRTEQAQHKVALFTRQYNEIQSSNLLIQSKLEQFHNEYNNYDLDHLLHTSNMILELNEDVDKLLSKVVDSTHQNDMTIKDMNILNQSVENLENNILNINNILSKNNLR